MDMLNTIWDFLARALAVPELAAILPAMCAGIAMTYLVQRLLPWDMRVRTAELIGRGVIFLTVIMISMLLHPTPKTLAWGMTVAIMAPLLHEKGSEFLYNKWPWMKPKALQTMVEQCRAPVSPP